MPILNKARGAAPTKAPVVKSKVTRTVIVLGDRVRDRVTGFTGIAIARTEWLFQCNQVLVQPEKLDKDGNHVKGLFFDEPWLDIVEENVHAPKYAVAVEGKPVSGALGRPDPRSDRS